jgi:hypothetical protein
LIRVGSLRGVEALRDDLLRRLGDSLVGMEPRGWRLAPGEDDSLSVAVMKENSSSHASLAGRSSALAAEAGVATRHAAHEIIGVKQKAGRHGSAHRNAISGVGADQMPEAALNRGILKDTDDQVRHGLKRAILDALLTSKSR